MATLWEILERIECKKGDYGDYDFSKTEYAALTAFFDLSQEFDSLDDLYHVCVAIPKVFFDLDARLYMMSPKVGDLSLVATTAPSAFGFFMPPRSGVRPSDHPYYADEQTLVLTIRGKKILIDQLPFETKDDVLGLLEVFPVKDLTPHREFFFEKYANRIGFNLHNRFLVEKNIEHLRFIRSLVADIEHNVIAPNMIYRLFLKHLRRKIVKNDEIERLLAQYVEKGAAGEVSREQVLAELAENNRGLMEELENIEKHYQNMSLFLETLFRRSHFDKGRLILVKKPCNMKIDVVVPQLERFAEQLREMGIAIDDRFSGLPDEEVVSVVDVGLMAQVYANLFSNALKYTREIVTHEGERKKYVAYGRELIPDCFGPGRGGIKYNVFNTGPHIKPEDREQIFDDGYRGSDAVQVPGTGHGLAFIKNAVEIHGGIVGYEPTQYGNNFYFILPQ